MPRGAPQPSDAEWKVLNALWRRHPASARELLERLRGEEWAYTTLKTMLTRMEEKGLVRATMRGNAAWYEPAIEQRAAQRSAVRRLIDRVFEGAAGPLLAHLAESERLGPAERKKLEAWIAEIGPAETGQADTDASSAKRERRVPDAGRKGAKRGRR